MIYNCSDINNSEMYNKSRVMFVTGQYAVFNSFVVDKFKEYYRTTVSNTDSTIIPDFGYEEINTTETLNSIDFDDFLSVVNTRSLNGKWFCNVQFSTLSKKQIGLLEDYYKKPSDNGVLIVNFTEFKEFMKYLRDKTLKSSESSNLIKLSFPNVKVLNYVIKSLLGDTTIEPKAIKLFIMRLGKNYNEYSSLLGKMKINYVNITYKDMLYELKGIENYTIDDFIIKLSTPLKTDKLSKRKKIYAIERALINDIGYKSLLYKVKDKINDLIEMRVLINNGHIPIGIKYNISKVQKILPEKHTLKKVSEYNFRFLNEVALKYSLRDLIIIKCILNTIVISKASNFECAKVLHSIINRTSFEKERILNDINISNNIQECLTDINRTKLDNIYKDTFKRIIIDEIYHIE